MQTKTHMKAGEIEPFPSGTLHQNQMLVRTQRPMPGLKVKTHVKAGGKVINHNQTLVRKPGKTTSLTVKTRIKAGVMSSGSVAKLLFRELRGL